MEFLTGFSTAWRIQGLTSMMGKAGGSVLADGQRVKEDLLYSDVLKPMAKLHHG